jgi:DNA-damage-inducible protein J
MEHPCFLSRAVLTRRAFGCPSPSERVRSGSSAHGFFPLDWLDARLLSQNLTRRRVVFKKSLDGVVRMQHIFLMKTAAVHSRIQPELKEQAEGILQRLGLSPTEAIRMFYTQITLRNGLPFEVTIPNDVTIKALEESRNGRNLERFDSTEELFESWNA